VSSLQPLVFAVVTAWVGEDWHSQQLVRALSAFGRAVVVDPIELAAFVEPENLSLRMGDPPMRARELDAVVLARGLSPKSDPEAQFSLYRALELMGLPVINRIEALLDAQDKFRTSLLLQQSGVPTPPAALALNPDQARRMVRRLGWVVLKPPFGSLGEGVELLAPGEEGEQRAAERAEADGAVYLQQYLPNPGRDLRVFVVGGRAVAAVERVASPGEFRTNVARGGTPIPAVLTPALCEAAESAARALGLDYTGVDLIPTGKGPQVIEVNGNPSFDMFWNAARLDMAAEIAAHVAQRARARRQALGAGEEAAAQAATGGGPGAI
jgi:ribosomal protein S6--L-glutamate ligase